MKKTGSYSAWNPGEIIRTEMEVRHWKERWLAPLLGVSPEEVRDLVAGRKSIDDALAKRLASTFGMSAQFWRNLQQCYDEEQERGSACAASGK